MLASAEALDGVPGTEQLRRGLRTQKDQKVNEQEKSPLLLNQYSGVECNQSGSQCREGQGFGAGAEE